MWNSQNHRIIGLAMSSDDQSSFLWRDLTSSFDIVGPFFTSHGTIEGKFVCACAMETIKLFQVQKTCSCNIRKQTKICNMLTTQG